MSTEIAKNSVRTLMQTEKAREQFENMLGKNSAAFIASVVQLSNKPELAKCEAKTVISAAVIAASLNLSVDPSLGQAAIIPFGQNASFQIMYKGLIQLALRSGQIQTINAIDVHEGDIISQNILTGEIKFTDKQNFDSPVVGYAAYIRLINGFEKSIYITKSEIEKHGKKYSKMFSRGVWNTDFDKMAQKTVLKMLLSKYAPLSTEMQTALKFDNTSAKTTNENDFNITDVEITETDFVEQQPEILENPTAKKISNENSK